MKTPKTLLTPPLLFPMPTPVAPPPLLPGPPLADPTGPAAPVERVGTLERAVERARSIAQPGDVVLLAPACSSYDQFANYEERGERFRELVSHAPAGRRR